MITGVEIGLGIKALKTAFDIAKEAKDLTDTTAMRSKIIEMQSLIMDAQASAIDAREAHTAQIDRIRELEKELADLEAWDREKQRYELNTVYLGAFAYVLKPDMAGSEPPHWICTSCYQNRRKSFLQRGKYIAGNYEWCCSVCSQSIRVGENFGPASPWQRP